MRYLLILLLLFSVIGLSHAQCTGTDFSASSTHVCAPGVVVLRATGYAPGSSFVWKIGTVQFTGPDSVVQVLSQKGFITVSLEVINAANQHCTITKSNYISVSEPEEPVLSVSSKVACSVPASIQLKNTTNGFSRIDWFVEGEKLLNRPDTLTYQFTSPGQKRIGLRVFDQYGCGRLHFFDSAISVNQGPQNAVISLGDQWGCNPVNIRYTVATEPASFPVKSYSWNLQGAITANISGNTPLAQAAYKQSGNYPVQLTLNTDAGCAYTYSQVFQVIKPDSVFPVFTASDTALCEDNKVDFRITSSAIQLPGTFSWIFQGGNLQTDTAINVRRANVSYETPGIYSVSLQHNYKNCITVSNKYNLLHVYPAKNNFISTDNIECAVPHTVHFQNVSPDSTDRTFLWRFFDSKGNQVDSSKTFSAAYTYTRPGSYKVEMLANRPGCKQSVSKINFVQIAKPKASFEGTQHTCMGDTTHLVSTTPVFTSDTVNYKWFLWNKSHTGMLWVTNTPSVQYTYPDTGYYDISFIVKSSKCADTVTQKKYVHIYQLSASLGRLTTPVCRDEPVVINKLVNYQPPQAAVTSEYYFWRAQDSASTNFKTSADINTFQLPGVYHMKAVTQASASCGVSSQAMSAIKVSGLQANLALVENTGCLPYRARVKVNVIYNVHFSKPGNHQVNYAWQLLVNGAPQPLTGNGYANCSLINDSICELYITKPAVFGFAVRLTNTDSCRYEIKEDNLLDLDMHAAFELAPKACKNSYQQVVNRSHNKFVRFRWVADSSQVSFLPSDTAASPGILFKSTGNIPITLQAYTAGNCMDTSTTLVSVADLDINFFTTDTIKKCAPALVHFEVKQQPGTTLSWQMGDGNNIQSTGDVFYMYGANTGNLADSGFTVTLHGSNDHGCSQTLTKSGYIKIIGPVPHFTTQQISGCEPLQVQFTNDSRNMSEHYFDYGDGTELDSNSLSWQHNYIVRQATAHTETYQPRLIAYDKDYCFSTYKMATPVQVHTKPVATFTADTLVACSGTNITLHDSTPLAIQWQWSVSNTIVAHVQHPVLNPGAGLFNVELLVFNQFGCSDTLIKPDYLRVYASPVADFEKTAAEVCPGTEVLFNSTSSGTQPIVSYNWTFGQKVIAGQATEKNPVFSFSTPGYKTVSLRVTDSVGCSHVKTSDSLLFVIDSVISTQPVLTGVTFNQGNGVEVSWQRENIRGFKEYQVYQSDINTDNWQMSAGIQTADVTHWVDSSLRALQVAQAYRVVVHNMCNNYSQPSATHNSIHLDLDTTVHATNSLAWNAFEGWPITFYRVYGSDNPSRKSFRLLTELADTHFAHGYICPGTKYYYIEVSSTTNPQLVSRSHVATGSPSYEIPAFVTPVALATVVNDGAIELTWNQELHKWKGVYEIDRHEEKRGWYLGYANSTDSRFLDENVQVRDTRYMYRIRFADTCSLKTPAGLPGTNILLQGNIENDKSVLNWTPYEKWEQGVNHYLVQLYKNNRFESLARVSPDSAQYTDADTHGQLDSAHVYRVLAVSTNFSDTSISNSVAATPASRVWIPNAFTPNGDGLNDVFLPVASGVYNEAGIATMQYELRIYNRWGELIFKTNSLLQGWDGSFRNSPCPADVYSYELYVAGVDYKKYNRAGTLHLLR